MLPRLHALVVPFLVLVVGLAYWVQIAGARPSVVLVPFALLALMGILLVIVVLREMRSPTPAPEFTFADVRGPLLLLGTFIAYYFLFLLIGFHLSNFILVFVVARLMSLPMRASLIIATSSGVIIYAITRILRFNIPESIILG